MMRKLNVEDMPWLTTDCLKAVHRWLETQGIPAAFCKGVEVDGLYVVGHMFRIDRNQRQGEQQVHFTRNFLVSETMPDLVYRTKRPHRTS